MRHRPGVLGELEISQQTHVGYPLHRPRAHIRRKLLVAEDGQALLEAELKPVAAGHPVAGPVVKVFMGDHTFDALEIGIGGRLGIRQDIFRVENVQTLVFHRPHVEIINGDDLVLFEIVFESIGLFIPAHGALQRHHGMIAFVAVAFLDKDLQVDHTLRHGHESIFNHRQASGHHGEEVAGLRERILECGEVAPILQLTGTDQVAVGQQHRRRLTVADQGGCETRHDIRSIRIKGDLAKALGFALGAIDATGPIQAFQRGIIVRVNLNQGLQLKRFRHARNRQPLVILDVVTGNQFTAVEANIDQLELAAIQGQCFGRPVKILIGTEPQARAHPGAGGVEFNMQFNRIYQMGRRLIVVQKNSFQVVVHTIRSIQVCLHTIP